VNEDALTFVAPFTLVAGALLFAAGALSFFGVHFFKTKLAERAALAGGLALIVATEFMFAMSAMSVRFFNGQRADVLECRLEAERALPEERHKGSPLIQEQIVSCMSRFGYEWSPGRARCDEAPVATNPFCYLPRRPFDRAVTRLQMMFR
jgi:hypothetical protein